MQTQMISPAQIAVSQTSFLNRLYSADAIVFFQVNCTIKKKKKQPIAPLTLGTANVFIYLGLCVGLFRVCLLEQSFSEQYILFRNVKRFSCTDSRE